MASVTSQSRAVAPWGLAGMLALLVLAEGFVARRGLDFLDVDDWACRLNRKAAQKDAPKADVLCFGDSLVKYGVSPRALAERTGWTALNLGVSGGLPASSDYLFRQTLDAGARPKAVVVDFFPPLNRAGPWHLRSRWASLLGTVEAADLAVAARDPELFGYVLTAKALPSLRGRDSVRAGVVAALSGAANPRRWANAVMLRNLDRNRGGNLFHPGDSVGRLTDAELDDFRDKFYGSFQCDPVNARAIDRFLTAAEARGVPVFWVLPPIAPGLQGRIEASGFDARHRAFVTRWQGKFPGLTVIDARHAVADPAAYYDPNHLSAEGAYAFSLALGDALRDPARARWLTLPPVRRGRLPDGPEDMEASALALDKVWGGARR